MIISTIITIIAIRNEMIRTMKKTLLITIALICTALVANAQIDREAMLKERMQQNKVKECEQYTHKFIKGKPKKEGYLTTKTTFDKKGNPLTVINYRSNGDESSRLYYAYNSKGQKVEYRKEEAWKDETTGKVSMKLFFKQTFTYDSKGNKKSEKGFDGLSQYRVIYNYLPNGKLSNITKYNADNSIAERWMYSYDGNTQMIHITPKNAEPYSVEKMFDQKGRLISDKQLTQDKSEKRRLEYTYDRQGRLATESEFYAGQLRFTLRYVYNNKGQLTEIMQRQPSGAELQNNAYKYDAQGNLIEEQWVESDPTLISRKASEFDASGDMVKMESFYAPYKYKVLYTYKYKRF